MSSAAVVSRLRRRERGFPARNRRRVTAWSCRRLDIVILQAYTAFIPSTVLVMSIFFFFLFFFVVYLGISAWDGRADGNLGVWKHRQILSPSSLLPLSFSFCTASRSCGTHSLSICYLALQQPLVVQQIHGFFSRKDFERGVRVLCIN
jgi:hypothetical protein